MPLNSLYHKYRAEAVEQLINEMRLRPNLCEINMWTMEQPEELQAESRAEWNAVVSEMQENYSEADERMIWVAWKSLYQRHGVGQTAVKWLSKLDFLIAKPKPLTYIATTPKNQQNSKQGRPKTQSSKKRRRCLDYESPNFDSQDDQFQVNSIEEPIVEPSSFRIDSAENSSLLAALIEPLSSPSQQVLSSVPLRPLSGTEKSRRQIDATEKCAVARSTAVNSLFNVHGQEACDLLISEAGNYPEFYKPRAGNKWYTEMSSKYQEAFAKIMAVMKKHFVRITETQVFQAWRQLRNRYSRNTCPEKYDGKIAYLNALPEVQAAKEVRKPRPKRIRKRKVNSEFMDREGEVIVEEIFDESALTPEAESLSSTEDSVGIPGATDTSLFEVYGQAASDLLIAEAGKYPEFYEPRPDRWWFTDMTADYKFAFGRIMEVISEHYDGVTADQVFKTWRFIRNRYGQPACPAKYIKKIPYLDGLPDCKSTRRRKIPPSVPTKSRRLDLESQPIGRNSSVARFAEKHGELVLDDLLRLIGEDPLFHRENLHVYKLDDLNGFMRPRWDDIMRKMQDLYPYVSSEEALTAWRSVRKHYFNPKRCPFWVFGKVPFLNEMIEDALNQSTMEYDYNQAITLTPAETATPEDPTSSDCLIVEPDAELDEDACHMRQLRRVCLKIMKEKSAYGLSRVNQALSEVYGEMERLVQGC